MHKLKYIGFHQSSKPYHYVSLMSGIFWKMNDSRLCIYTKMKLQGMVHNFLDIFDIEILSYLRRDELYLMKSITILNIYLCIVHYSRKTSIISVINHTSTVNINITELRIALIDRVHTRGK